MSAQDILNAMDKVRPNHGLKLRDIQYFLNNSANVKLMEGKTVEEVARYICSVYLDIAGTY
ncbi:hypothetical protein KJZ63_00345 [Patescibacteria group bacterium]|nr:hypothetical protein [Patescibacteria group bacterium]